MSHMQPAGQQQKSWGDSIWDDSRLSTDGLRKMNCCRLNRNRFHQEFRYLRFQSSQLRMQVVLKLIKIFQKGSMCLKHFKTITTSVCFQDQKYYRSKRDIQWVFWVEGQKIRQDKASWSFLCGLYIEVFSTMWSLHKVGRWLSHVGKRPRQTTRVQTIFCRLNHDSNERPLICRRGHERLLLAVPWNRWEWNCGGVVAALKALKE